MSTSKNSCERWLIRVLISVVLLTTAQFLIPDELLKQFRLTVHAAGPFTVNSLGDTPDALAGNGICADANGVCTLRAAIQEANSLTGDDTITFSITGTIDLTGPLPDVTSNITIVGPSSSLLTVRRSTGGDYRIFFNNNRILNISGLTIANGKTADGGNGSTNGGSAASGGGILNFGSMTLSDVVITGNATGNGGNALDPGSTFGAPGGYGGGISSSGSLTMTNVTVSNNVTGHGGDGGYGHHGGFGGGIQAAGSLIMSHCIVTGNQTGNGGVGSNAGASGGSGGSGGGIEVDSGTYQFSDVDVSHNRTGNGAGESGEGGDGAGVFVQGTGTIINSAIAANITGNGSGGFIGQDGLGAGIFNAGSLTVTGTTINHNIGGSSSPFNGGQGGGVFNAATLKMFNSTVSSNSCSGSGGGLHLGGTVNLTNVTVTANSSHLNGGGINSPSGGNIILTNTIVADNLNVPSSTPSDISGIMSSSSSFSLVGTGGNGGLLNGVNNNKVGVAPMLGPLAANGGSTLTHTLLPGSPALDSGSNALALDANNNTLASDQRGAGRFANSAGPGIGTVDIGAYEYHPSLEDVTDKTTNEDVPLVVSFAVGENTNVASLSASSDNQALIPDENLTVSSAGPVRTLRVVPLANESGTAHITLTLTQNGGPITTDSFLVTVLSSNDAPTFIKGSDQVVNEDAPAQTISNWATSISAGPPNEAGQSLTFNISNTNAALFSTGPAISSDGTLTYTPAPNAFGSATLGVTLIDNGGTANGGQNTSATQTFTITVNSVNDAPSFTAGSDQTVNEDSGFQFVSGWASAISAGPNESNQPLTFVITNNSNPTMFSSGPAISPTGTLTYATATDANGTAAITVALKDNGGTANGGVDTSATKTFNITVSAVNDAPVNHAPFNQTTGQNTPLTFSPATFNSISVSDVDAGVDPIKITLTGSQGTLTLGTTTGLTFSTGDGTDDATMTFMGTLTNVNTALSGLAFKPNNGFNGSANIQITADDQGHNGSGGAKTDTDTVFINVQSGGTLQFGSSSYAVNEDTGTAVITVTRAGGGGGAASVNYATGNGTASSGATCAAGVDYVNTSGTLSWSNNDTTAKTFSIPICPDVTNELDETVKVTLSSAGGSGSLGSTVTSTLTITNDDFPVLLTEENSDRAIALDSFTMTRDPFTLLYPINIGSDNRRRVSLFVWRFNLLPSDTALNVTALAEDDQGTSYPLTVEYVGPVNSLVDVTQVIVKLPDSVVGTPRDLFVKVSLRGPGSNRGRITISGP